MHQQLEKEWDGLITSPPYLNGTNYIRNARLELWYLRHIANKADMRLLRDAVITSGINDVSARTRWAPVTVGVERVVRELQDRSYDSRIAKMVGGYFADMAAVLRSCWECVDGGARLCIDIGDSIYGGIHVPTDDLLVELAGELHYRVLDRVHLRKRVSKGGAAVRQQLLVFEKPGPRSSRRGKTTFANELPNSIPGGARRRKAAKSGNDWETKWAQFKSSLPHQKQPYAKREWGGPVHSMCSYQGKMKPALGHHLVEVFSSAGDVVVDPFSGAGTIPFEACRMARHGYGMDLSRLGHVLTAAKICRSTPAKV
jgi:DNA modification methylase